MPYSTIRRGVRVRLLGGQHHPDGTPDRTTTHPLDVYAVVVVAGPGWATVRLDARASCSGAGAFAVVRTGDLAGLYRDPRPWLRWLRWATVWAPAPLWRLAGRL